MLKGQILLGGEAFAAQVQPLLEGAAGSKEVPRTQRWAHRPTLRSMFIKSVRADKLKRDEAIRCAYNDYGYTMAAIARELGLHYSTVSKVIKGER
jgi:DNA invertase Pin-like site-specific DNA recombinase